MNTPRVPKHLRALASVGVTLAEYWQAQSVLAERGISAGWSDARRSWVVSAVNKAPPEVPGPTVVTCWCGLGAFVDFLKNPDAAVAAMKARMAS